MARTYNSPRRANSKARTIQDILNAALKLHGQGITDLPSVAREGGVALATVTKYFPTREDLFRGCAEYFMETHPLPTPVEWAQILDPGQRLEHVVAQVYAGFEVAAGQIWLAHRLAGESPVMAGTVQAVEAWVQAATEVLVGDSVQGEERQAIVGYIRGLLGPLTYRSLRVNSYLTPEIATRQTVRAIAGMLGTHKTKDPR